MDFTSSSFLWQTSFINHFRTAEGQAVAAFSRVVLCPLRVVCLLFSRLRVVCLLFFVIVGLFVTMEEVSVDSRRATRKC